MEPYGGRWELSDAEADNPPTCLFDFADLEAKVLPAMVGASWGFGPRVPSRVM